MVELLKVPEGNIHDEDDEHSDRENGMDIACGIGDEPGHKAKGHCRTEPQAAQQQLLESPGTA